MLSCPLCYRKSVEESAITQRLHAENVGFKYGGRGIRVRSGSPEYLAGSACRKTAQEWDPLLSRVRSCVTSKNKRSTSGGHVRVRLLSTHAVSCTAEMPVGDPAICALSVGYHMQRLDAQNTDRYVCTFTHVA